MSRKYIIKNVFVTALAVLMTTLCIVSFYTLFAPGFKFVTTFLMGPFLISIITTLLIIISPVPLWMHKNTQLKWFIFPIIVLPILSLACFNPYGLETVPILMSQIENYNSSDSDALLLDNIQRQFKCCGLNPDLPGRFQFERFNCHFKRDEVPISCCRIPDETLPEWLVGKPNKTAETLPQGKPETKQKAKPVPKPEGKPVRNPKPPPQRPPNSAPVAETPPKMEPFKCTKTPTNETAYSSGCDKNIQLYYINNGSQIQYVISTCAPIFYGVALLLFSFFLNKDTDDSDSDSGEDDNDDDDDNDKEMV